MNIDLLPAAPGYFIAGTDTGIGKTYVACQLVESLVRSGKRVSVMKPVAAGVDVDGMNEDVRRLSRIANVQAEPADVNPYCFAPAIAPHLAAAQDNVTISMDVIKNAAHRLGGQADVLVVEGVGGLLVPLAPGFGAEHIPAALGFPVILVVGIRLGCLNQALLTCEALAARNLPLIGWVANRIDPEMPFQEENIETLKSLINAPCLADFRLRRV